MDTALSVTVIVSDVVSKHTERKGTRVDEGKSRAVGNNYIIDGELCMCV